MPVSLLKKEQKREFLLLYPVTKNTVLAEMYGLTPRMVNDIARAHHLRKRLDVIRNEREAKLPQDRKIVLWRAELKKLCDEIGGCTDYDRFVEKQQRISWLTQKLEVAANLENHTHDSNMRKRVVASLVSVNINNE